MLTSNLHVYYSSWSQPVISITAQVLTRKPSPIFDNSNNEKCSLQRLQLHFAGY
jgi:hypothetical protein